MRLSSLLCHICVLLSLGVLLFSFNGCGTSTPRFSSKEKTRVPEQKKDEPQSRFSSQEVKKEQKKKTTKVDTTNVERIKIEKSDFRKEKNEAIEPLDQSRMMREISKYMGVPYVSGGASSQGMDCSGYTMMVYKNAMNIELPRSSAEQYKMGRAVGQSELKFGDLVFFNTTGEPASHVGIYIGDDLFAHASVSLGVTISSLQSSYYSKRYTGARRIIE